MPISRLLFSKPGGPTFHARGLTQSTKWSSFSGDGSEKAPKESAAVDKNSKKESVSLFKGILTNIKQTVFGSSQSREPNAGKTSNSKVGMTASEVTMTQNSSQSREPIARETSDSKVGMTASEVTMTQNSSKTQEPIASETSDSKVGMTASEVTMTQNSPDDIKFLESQSVLQSPEGRVTSPSSTEGVSTCSITNKVEENAFEGAVVTTTSEVEGSSLKMNQSGKLSDIFVKKMKYEVEQSEEAMSDVLVECNDEQSRCGKNFIGSTIKLINEKHETLSDGKNDLSSLENMYHPLGKKIATLVQRPNPSTNSGKKHTSSGYLSSTLWMDILKTEQNNPVSGGTDGKLHDTLAPTESSAGRKVEEEQDMQNIIERIKDLSGELSTDKANLQSSDVKRRKRSLKHHMSSENKISLDKKEKSSIRTEAISESEGGSNLNLPNSDHVKSRPKYPMSSPISKEELNSSSPRCFTKKGSKEYKVLVRFVTQNIQRCDILAAFFDCRPIVNAEEVSSTKQSMFKDFMVHFETREGYQIALKKTDLRCLNPEAFVEATFSEDMDHTIPIPDLIGDPDVPVALVKNPTKTVKVKQLSEDISSQQLKEALAFCQSGISRFIWGSTSSVGYMELETEDAKERALAKHSILVSGKQLPILRIDAPRTTVVRISNVKLRRKVWTICNSFGQVKHTADRGMDIVDVHFDLAEWPNMLHIVNSLNGREVDGNRWLVHPAPIFPPAILRALWSQPEERRHVKSVMCSLLRKLDKPAEFSELTGLAAMYYCKE